MREIVIIIIIPILFLLLSNTFSQAISYEVLFCPIDECEQRFLSLIHNSSSIYCALYDLNSELIIDALNKKKATSFTDKYIPGLKNQQVDKKSVQSHNKFCIFDNKTVLTGSTNPTKNGFTKNNNNMFIIHSKKLAKNYLVEFKELTNYEKVQTPYSKVQHIQNYFCPEDNCEKHVLNELSKAQDSIHFMTFSFTSGPIATDLLKKNLENVSIQGIMDYSQITIHSQFDRLEKNNISVVNYRNSYGGKMHHKVFIIDKKIVITGSYNPTQNGNKYNDENILIIEDELLAKKYLEEFQMLLFLTESNAFLNKEITGEI